MNEDYDGMNDAEKWKRRMEFLNMLAFGHCHNGAESEIKHFSTSAPDTPNDLGAVDVLDLIDEAELIKEN